MIPVVDVPSLNTNRSSNIGPATIIDVLGHDTFWFRDIQFSRNNSCEAEGREFRRFSDLWDVCNVSVVEQSVLEEIEVLFQLDAVLTYHVIAIKRVVQRIWALLREKLHELQKKVPTKSLSVVKFSQEVIAKNE